MTYYIPINDKLGAEFGYSPLSTGNCGIGGIYNFWIRPCGPVATTSYGFDIQTMKAQINIQGKFSRWLCDLRSRKAFYDEVEKVLPTIERFLLSTPNMYFLSDRVVDPDKDVIGFDESFYKNKFDVASQNLRRQYPANSPALEIRLFELERTLLTLDTAYLIRAIRKKKFGILTTSPVVHNPNHPGSSMVMGAFWVPPSRMGHVGYEKIARSGKLDEKAEKVKAANDKKWPGIAAACTKFVKEFYGRGG